MRSIRFFRLTLLALFCAPNSVLLAQAPVPESGGYTAPVHETPPSGNARPGAAGRNPGAYEGHTAPGTRAKSGEEGGASTEDGRNAAKGGEGNAGAITMEKILEWNKKAADKSILEAKRFRAETQNDDLKKLADNVLAFEARVKQVYGIFAGFEEKRQLSLAFTFLEAFSTRRQVMTLAMRCLSLIETQKGDVDSAASRAVGQYRQSTSEALAASAESIDALIQAQVKWVETLKK